MIARLLAPLRLRVVGALTAAGIVLAGCASQVAYDPSLSPAQNQLRQSNARFNQTVGEGAAVGAVVGGLAGLALGGRNRVAAAAGGAVVGGALGAGAGYLVARNNLSRSSTEAQYAGAIQEAQSEAAKFHSSAQVARQVADQAYADAQRLNAQLRAGQITQAQYRAGLSKYQADSEAIQVQIAQAQKTSAAMRQDAGNARGPNRGQLAQSAAAVDSSARELSQQQARISRLLAGEA